MQGEDDLRTTIKAMGEQIKKLAQHIRNLELQHHEDIKKLEHLLDKQHRKMEPAPRIRRSVDLLLTFSHTLFLTKTIHSSCSGRIG